MKLNVKTKIRYNGQEYSDPNQLPPEVRAAYQKAMRKRSVWVEPLFGEAKQWHGLRRFRLRGLENVNMEGLLVAAGQNLKRWLVATGWGRRHGPLGSLLALPAQRRFSSLPATSR